MNRWSITSLRSVRRSAEVGNVVYHFHARLGVAALFVKLFLFLAAVENRLCAAGALGDRVEGSHHEEAEAFALVLLGDADLFDVADDGAVVDATNEWC